jgi:hypothetical protein
LIVVLKETDFQSTPVPRHELSPETIDVCWFVFCLTTFLVAGLCRYECIIVINEMEGVWKEMEGA